jgi:hypothetical protein
VLEVTVRDLEDLLKRFAKPSAATGFAGASGLSLPLNRYNVAWSARQNKLLPTLASAWRAEGQTVEAGLVAEADAHQRRAERYARTLNELVAQVGPGVRPFKGPVIASTYPSGWVRRTGDLDIEASGLDEAVAVGRHLQDRGWQVIRLTVFKDSDGPRIALNIVDVNSGDAILDFDWVQLQGFGFRGDPWRLPPRASFPAMGQLTPRARTLLALIEEISQRRVIARDLLDFALLVNGVSDTEWPALTEALDGLGLSPELGQLQERTHAVGLLRGKLMPAASASSSQLLRRRRVRSSWRHMRARLYGRGPDADARLFAAGYPLSGTPDPHDRTATFSVRCERGDGARFRGPLGSGRLHFYGTI